MKKFSEQLYKKAQSVKLQTAEKNELRERLVSYMEYHPLPAEMKAAVRAEKKVFGSEFLSEGLTMVQIPFMSIFKTSAVAAAIVLLVVPFIAERAVPGDSLYAVKVQFNEEIRGTLTFDSYQKVEWETERLNRRIAEARLLASEGRLTEEVEAEVAEAVKTHTENAQREIEVLRIEDADEATMASIALDTTLEVQSNSLRDEANMKESEDGSESLENKSTNLIASVIDKSRSDSEAKNGSTTVPAYDKLMARVEQNTTRVYELLGSLEKVTDQTQLTDVTRRIEDIERAITEAMALREQDEMQSRNDLVGILQRTQRLIVFMTEQEVTNKVDIETLVPVVPTDEEESVIRQDHTDSVASDLIKIKFSLVRVDDKEVAEKVRFAVGKITTLSLEMASSTDFDSFENLAKEATNLTKDTMVLLEKSIVPEAEDVEVIVSSSTENIIETEVATGTEASTTEDIVIIEETTL